MYITRSRLILATSRFTAGACPRVYNMLAHILSPCRFTAVANPYVKYMQIWEPYAHIPVYITCSRLILVLCRFTAGTSPHAYNMLATHITSMSPRRGRESQCQIYANLPKGTICSYPCMYYTLATHITSVSLQRGRQSLCI